MNQSYAEAGVKRRDDAITLGLRALMILGIAVGGILLILGGVFSIIGAVVITFLVFMFPRLNIEYEYVFVDGQLDFDRITGKAKRKTLLRIDMEQIVIVAQEGSHALDSYNHIQCEKKDFTSGDRSIKPTIIIANKDQKKIRIAFEPSETMLTMMRQKGPSKVILY